MGNELPTDAEILALAQAVIRRGTAAVIYGEDQKTVGFGTIEEAMASGMAFAVQPKASLLALDLDSEEVPDPDQVLEVLDAHSVRYVLVASGRPGNRHAWVNCGQWGREGVKDLLGRLTDMPAANIRVTATRPPLSPHQLRYQPALIEPVTVEEALTVLGPPEPPRGVPDAAWRLLYEGDTQGRYKGNRSAVAMAIAAYFARAGWTLTDYKNAMMAPANKGGAKAHELAALGYDADAFLVRTWDKARKTVEATPNTTAEHARTMAWGLMEAVLAHPWAGRTGGTDKAVMTALCDLAFEVGTLVPAPGERRLTVLAQTGSRNTTSKSLGRLVAAGWLLKEPTSNKQVPTGYRLVLRDDRTGPSIDRPPMSTDGSLLTHPVFRQGSGLGKRSGQVFHVLQVHGPLGPVQEIAGYVGCVERTVQRALKALTEHGLVMKQADGWSAVATSDDLDRVAKEIGAADVAERQRERFELEQRRQDEWIGSATGENRFSR